MRTLVAKSLSIAVLTLLLAPCHAPGAKAQTAPVPEAAAPAAQSSEPDFISGGVGEEDRVVFETKQKDYALKVVFAGQGGIFLDDVHVVITDAKKQAVITTDTQGPILLANIKPGKYLITAETQGQTQKQAITIKKGHQTNITLRFAISD